ncbi:MAG: ImmA/IrrE family metallo-endopeptidase [Clostridiales bacterium]|nr:ImmA/IrrE family metallo-endopeptidase [Clostridiales bacterium]MCF8022636.1 ImmA/IrrE family metallo-endopeptidase [Clostridiales bacterium]
MKPTYIRQDFAVEKARKFRNELGYLGPIKAVEKIIKARDIIIERTFTPSCSFVLWEENLGYVIFLVPTQPERDRWTLVHEFAHIHLGHFNYSVNCAINDNFYNNLKNKENYILEREADIFTAEFLMPKELVNCLATNSQSLKQIGKLKNHFGVSWEAMINRLDELSIISKNKINAR